MGSVTSGGLGRGLAYGHDKVELAYGVILGFIGCTIHVGSIG